jgi:hypothetical protein
MANITSMRETAKQKIAELQEVLVLLDNVDNQISTLSNVSREDIANRFNNINDIEYIERKISRAVIDENPLHIMESIELVTDFKYPRADYALLENFGRSF